MKLLKYNTDKCNVQGLGRKSPFEAIQLVTSWRAALLKNNQVDSKLATNN